MSETNIETSIPPTIELKIPHTLYSILLPSIPFPNIDVEIAKLELENNGLKEQSKEYQSRIAHFEERYTDNTNLDIDEFHKYCDYTMKNNELKSKIYCINNNLIKSSLANMKSIVRELKIIEETIAAFTMYSMRGENSLISINYKLNQLMNKANKKPLIIHIDLPNTPKIDINSSIRTFLDEINNRVAQPFAALKLSTNINNVLNTYNSLLEKELEQSNVSVSLDIISLNVDVNKFINKLCLKFMIKEISRTQTAT